MKWRKVRNPNVEYRRGASGFGGGLPRGVALGGGLGLPTLLVLAVVFLLNGGLGGSGFDVDNSLNDLGTAGQPAGDSLSAEERRLFEFVKFVDADVQGFWSDTFAQSGREYREAGFQVFDNAVPSACGGATEAVGPHYCPADESVYLDLDFFRELRVRFGAPGDFAQAYVIAHEMGHHVQNLTGISGQVGLQQRGSPDQANALSIRLELQADCLAGVWAFTTYERRLLEEGDLEEGLAAAAAVGDDRIQAQATGRVDPESWTHGSSEQRTRWFAVGFQEGDPNACDTFSVDSL